MHKHDSYLNEHEAGISGFKSGIFLTLASICFIFMLNSCGQSSKSDVSNTEDSEATEYFHADNDIAMTVRSLADAIKVGEPLDSTEYDFNGVLTDGQGAPLYTDVQGSPGTWIVDVLDKKMYYQKPLSRRPPPRRSGSLHPPEPSAQRISQNEFHGP